MAIIISTLCLVTFSVNFSQGMLDVNSRRFLASCVNLHIAVILVLLFLVVIGIKSCSNTLEMMIPESSSSLQFWHVYFSFLVLLGYQLTSSFQGFSLWFWSVRASSFVSLVFLWDLQIWWVSSLWQNRRFILWGQRPPCLKRPKSVTQTGSWCCFVTFPQYQYTLTGLWRSSEVLTSLFYTVTFKYHFQCYCSNVLCVNFWVFQVQFSW